MDVVKKTFTNHKRGSWSGVTKTPVPRAREALFSFGHEYGNCQPDRQRKDFTHHIRITHTVKGEMM